jgi:ribosomal protein S13
MGDPYQSASESILASRNLVKAISHIGLIELSSTISRLRAREELQVPKEVEKALSILDFGKQTYSLLLFMLKHGDVKVLVPNALIKLHLNGFDVKMSTMLVEALDLAPKALLKTLDNLHVASLTSLVKEGHSIHYMVTGDEELLRVRKTVTNITGIPIVSPQDLVKLELL